MCSAGSLTSECDDPAPHRGLLRAEQPAGQPRRARVAEPQLQLQLPHIDGELDLERRRVVVIVLIVQKLCILG